MEKRRRGKREGQQKGKRRRKRKGEERDEREEKKRGKQERERREKKGAKLQNLKDHDLQLRSTHSKLGGHQKGGSNCKP